MLEKSKIMLNSPLASCHKHQVELGNDDQNFSDIQVLTDFGLTKFVSKVGHIICYA